MSKEFVDQIKKMTVMELVETIKEIEEEFGVSASAPAAVAASAAPAAAGAAAEEKTEFKVTLKEVGSEKIKVIKALRSVIPGLSLKDAKEMAESAPCVVAEAAPKEEANKMKEAIEAAGAKAELS
jgi:large subunit ribosomal protein L7/L12